MAQKRFSLRFLFSRPQQVTIFRVTRSTICICNLLVFWFFLSGCFCWKCELLPQTGAQRAATSPTTSTQYPPKRLGKLLCSNLSPSLQTRLYKYMNSFFAFSFTSCSQRTLRPQLSRSLNCICLLFFFFLHRRLSSRAPIWHWSTWAKSMASKVVPSSTCPPWQVTYCKNPSKYNVFRIFAQSVKGILHLKNKKQNDTLETQF